MTIRRTHPLPKAMQFKQAEFIMSKANNIKKINISDLDKAERKKIIKIIY